MNYIQEYKKFINGYYFSEAIRITIGITLPALVFNYFGLLHIGMVVSLGALAASTSDVPGPIIPRRNGIAATILLSFIVAVIVGFAAPYKLLLGLIIAALCFVLSMLGVYGARVNAIGFAGLLIMVLNMDADTRGGWDVLANAGYLVGGGLWYMLLSLALFGARPYRVVQQALGDSIIAIGDYLKIRAMFYEEDVNYDDTYRRLMQQQLAVQEKHTLVRELLFKSRSIVKDSTVAGRTLLIIFVESIDLFEKASATIYNYESMHNRFDEAGILPRFHALILEMVDELHDIGIAVQSGRPSHVSRRLQTHLRELKTYFESFAASHRNPDNFTAILNLRKVMESIDDMAIRLYTLHHYTRYDKNKTRSYKLSNNYDKFIDHTDISPSLLLENLSFKSNIFRHALRMSLTTTVGYIIAHLLNLGHSYWVLLTIIVILKPTYSLSKDRNYSRLAGTVIGALAGLGILYLVPAQTGRFASMLFLMVLTYSFMRTKYFISVTFMTAYILILFFLLNSKNFVEIFENRIIDTAIGSIIAFISTYIFVPSWEKQQIKTYMSEALQKTIAYFTTASSFYTVNPAETLNYKLSRKNAFVAQANLSGAFTRMMNEPKSKRENVKNIHQYVVFIFTLNSHIATLAYYSQKYKSTDHQTHDYEHVAADIIQLLSNTRQLFEDGEANMTQVITTEELNSDIGELVEKRRRELQKGLLHTETRATLIEVKPVIDQFLLISRISTDLQKLVKEKLDVGQ